MPFFYILYYPSFPVTLWWRTLSDAFLLNKSDNTLDQIQIFHNASVPYPTMHHLVMEMCTFPFQSGASWDMK